MTDYECAYNELITDDTYRSFVDELIGHRANGNTEKIYQRAYNTIYLNNSFLLPSDQQKEEALTRSLSRHFRNRVSSIPYFKYEHIYREKIAIEKNKLIADREAGAYILDTPTYPKTQPVIYPYIQKTRMFNDAIFFWGDNVEQPSTFFCRFYFNAKPELFLTLLQDLSNRLESLDLPHMIKHFFRQDRRIDNTILYVLPKYANLVYLALQESYASISPLLNEPSPRFTKKLFDGIAFSESPYRGESFGFHRCRVLSDYVVDSREKGEELPDFKTGFTEHLVLNKVNTERPYLNLHSNHRNYIFLHENG